MLATKSLVENSQLIFLNLEILFLTIIAHERPICIKAHFVMDYAVVLKHYQSTLRAKARASKSMKTILPTPVWNAVRYLAVSSLVMAAVEVFVAKALSKLRGARVLQGHPLELRKSRFGRFGMHADIDERNTWDKAIVRALALLTLALGLCLEYGSESRVFPQTATGDIGVLWVGEKAGIAKALQFEYSNQPIVKSLAGQVAYRSENAAMAASKHAKYVARAHEHKSEPVLRHRSRTRSKIRLRWDRGCIMFERATNNWTLLSRTVGVMQR